MDLIYADAQRQDVGVMMAYTLDMAYGSDENSFVCTIDANDHCCGKGYFLYVEGEEYGGIVDSIEPDTEKGEISYKGRTWHGILEKKVICPPAGQDYAEYDGDANTVLGEIITQIGLAGIFEASSTASNIDINNYRMDRFIPAYDGICKMLASVDAKLIIRWSGEKVQLSAVDISDYSQNEEFDSSQVNFRISHNYRPLNHIVCLGQGDLADRAVIHIFADENGAIQPYATTANPVEDSDYILDESQKVLTGTDEVQEALDYSSAEIVTNYLLTTSQPSDWQTAFANYFVHDGEQYKGVERIETGYVLLKRQPADWPTKCTKYFQASGSGYAAVTETAITYELTTSRPADWATKYKTYFTKSGSTYSPVQGMEKVSYIRQTKKPKDWWTHFANYYYYYSDGVTTEYRAVEGISYNTYTVQTQQPTDWATNYTQYYRRANAKEKQERPWIKYVALSSPTPPTWKKKTYYTAFSHQKPPEWSERGRYTKQTTIVAPTWEANRYYDETGGTAPAFARNTYYEYDSTLIPPTWTEGTYFRQAIDRYAVMVQEAIQRIEAANNAEEMSIDLDETDQTYDIGDLVGAREERTGISAVQTISKKIIKIVNNIVTITYEVS